MVTSRTSRTVSTRAVGMMMASDARIGVLQQMQAIKAALSKVEDAILKDHAATCVETAIQNQDQQEQRQKFNELIDLVGKIKG